MSDQTSFVRVVPKGALAVCYFAAAFVGGVIANQVLDFALNVVLPSLSQGEGLSSVSYGAGNAIVLSLVGGLPAAGISLFLASRSVMTIGRVLKSAWVGPAATAVLLVVLLFLLWPAAAGLAVVVAGLVGVACAILFELAAALSCLFARPTAEALAEPET